MKILSISSDRNIFIKNSETQKRMMEYGMIFKELHIIVFANKRLGYSDIKLAENVFVYPTNQHFKFLYLWNIYRIIKSLIISRQLSAVTVQDPFEAGIAGWMIKLLFKLPMQIQIHTDIFSPFFFAESLSNKLRVLCAKFLLSRADGIRVVSERIKNSLLTFDHRLSAMVTVLPIFVDVKKIQSAKVKINLHEKYPDADFIILMASRLTKEKNIGMAIEATKSVVEKYPKALLLIVGSGPEDINLKFLASKYGILDSNIKFEPWTENLISYYKTADLFLLTSNYEGYGRTVIEAMAAGLPVIMTDVGIAGEILIDDLDGKIIPVNDTAALVSAIELLIGNKQLRESFSEESAKALFSWADKKEYLESYKKSFQYLK